MKTLQSDNDPVVLVLVGIMCWLSIIGCVLIIFSYVKWKELRTRARLLLVFLSIADFFTATGNFFGLMFLSEEGNFCLIQSVVTTTSSLVSFFWTVFVAWYLFLSLPGRVPTSKNMVFFHTCAWGIPCVVVGIALGFNVLGYNPELWCWVAADAEHYLAWGWFTGKFWEVLSYLVTFILYYYIRRELKKISKKRSNISGSVQYTMSRADFKLMLIPLIFICVRIWGTIRFIIYHFEDYDERWLLVLQGMGDSAQGFANFLLFCIFTRKVRRKYLGLCFPKLRSEEEEPLTTNSKHGNVDVY